MVYREIRAEAWKKLAPSWSVFAVITLVYGTINGILGGSGGSSYAWSQSVTITFNVIVSIAALFLSGAFKYGYSKCGLHVSDKKTLKFKTFFDGFEDFTRAFILSVLNAIFIFLWSLLLIIPGIIAALSYSMSYYILIENPNISASEAMERSVALMDGHKFQYFCLMLTFVGWILLSILTFGILMLWIRPYMETTKADFYRMISAQPEEVQAEVK
ncbi:MAG: DUF975 family protein [Clostridia bacterium]|nr:DUF975 family protein [Clostridia bacterium]